MQIRARLTLQFVLIVALIQLGASFGIYWTAAGHRKQAFFEKLKASGISKTLLLLEYGSADSSRLRDLEELSTSFLPREEVLLFNYKNDLLYASDPRRKLQIDPEWLDKVRINKEIRFEQDGYELAGVMFTDRYNRLVVISGGIDSNGWGNLDYLRNVLVVVYLLSLAVVWLLAWVYSGGALRPIQQIMRQTDLLNVARLSDRINTHGRRDELGKLTDTINRLLDRIERSFEMQKQFVSNASHELRTPLTAIKGQLEVVLMKTRQPEVYAEKMESLLEDIRQLTNITNQLLMLAQTDTGRAREQFTAVRIDEVLFGCQSKLQKWQSSASILIMLDEQLSDADALILNGNEELLSTAFYNLMENALKYSPRKEVRVRLSVDRDQIVVVVEDDGIGIPADALHKIFQPFYRSENAKGIQGSGLGLSLVERIVVMHGGSIQVRSTPGEGSVFTVSLPHDLIHF